jgi:hypothetical protein
MTAATFSHPFSIETQIACFGQTPPALFSAPHPPRRAALPFVRPLHWGPAEPHTAAVHGGHFDLTRRSL